MASEADKPPLTEAHELGLVIQESFENYARLLGRRIGLNCSLLSRLKLRLLTTDWMNTLKI